MTSYTRFTYSQLQRMETLQLQVVPQENFSGYELKWESAIAPRLRYWYNPLTNHVIITSLRNSLWLKVYEYYA